MARAKRTDRTDARRRYRAEQAASGIDPAAEPTEATVEPSPSRGRGASAGGPTPAVARPSITRAIRGAVRPLDIRGDLRALPQLALHWSVLVSAGIAIIATVLFTTSASGVDFTTGVPLASGSPAASASVAPGGSPAVSVSPAASPSFAASASDAASAGSTTGASPAPSPSPTAPVSMVTTVAYLLVSLFVLPPPAAGAFLIGYFAKRASWAVGLLFGIIAAVCYAAMGIALSKGNASALVAQGLIIGPIGAALFASAAAWYRRFLDLVNPNRGKRPTRQQGRGGSRSKDRPVAAARRR